MIQNLFQCFYTYVLEKALSRVQAAYAGYDLQPWWQSALGAKLDALAVVAALRHNGIRRSRKDTTLITTYVGADESLVWSTLRN